jgi:hypothetical protein
MKRLILVLALFLVFAGTGSAQLQQYVTGIGVKVGKFNSGLTFKRFFHTDNATGIQADLCFTHIADDGVTLKGLVLRQLPFKVPIIQLPLDFIFGAGLHTGFFPVRTTGGGYYKIVDGEAEFYNKDVMTAGVDATLQIEYRIPLRKVPFTFGIDCTPFYEFVHRGPEWIDFGVAVRYVFH